MFASVSVAVSLLITLTPAPPPIWLHPVPSEEEPSTREKGRQRGGGWRGRRCVRPGLPVTARADCNLPLHGYARSRDQRPETRDQRPETRDQRPETRDQRPAYAGSQTAPGPMTVPKTRPSTGIGPSFVKGWRAIWLSPETLLFTLPGPIQAARPLVWPAMPMPPARISRLKELPGLIKSQPRVVAPGRKTAEPM